MPRDEGGKRHLLALVIAVAAVVLGGVAVPQAAAADVPAVSPTPPTGQTPEGTRPESGTPPRQPTPTAGPPDNPWGKETVVVAIDNRADPSRNVTPLVDRAIDYWQTDGAPHAKYSPHQFSLRPDAENPDLLVVFTDDVRCRSEHAIGCSSFVDGRVPVESVRTVRVKGGWNDRTTLRVLEHEFGHVLGLTHCEEPYWLMGSGCRSSAVPDAPNVDERDHNWRTTTLALYVDDAGGDSGANAARGQVHHAVAAYVDGADGELPADVTLVTVDDPLAADIVIDVDGSACAARPSCARATGYDFDGDGELEYYQTVVIVLNDPDHPAIDRHVRYWLAWSIGYDAGDGPTEHDAEAGGDEPGDDRRAVRRAAAAWGDHLNSPLGLLVIELVLVVRPIAPWVGRRTLA